MLCIESSSSRAASISQDVAQIWCLGSSLRNYRTSVRNCTPIVHFVFQLFIIVSSSVNRFRFCFGSGRPESACSDPNAVLEYFTLVVQTKLFPRICHFVGIDQSSARPRVVSFLFGMEAPTFSKFSPAFPAT